MSLLNEALRKKNKELKQSPRVNLFPGKPSDIWFGKAKKYVFFVLPLFVGIVIVLGIWLWPFYPRAPLNKHQTAGTSPDKRGSVIFKGSRPPLPIRFTSPAVSKSDPVPASRKNSNAGKDQKIVSEQKQTLTYDHNTPKKPLLPKALKTGDEKKGQRTLPGQKCSSAGPSHGSEGPFYLKAVSYHRRNELAKAIEMYQEILRKNPEHYDALFNLGSAYLTVSSFSQASAIFRKLHERRPGNPRILVNLAIAEIGLGRPRKAILWLNDAEAMNDRPQFLIYFHKGIALSKLHKLKDAEICYKKAERLNPGDLRLLFNLAVLYDKLQKYQDALNYYNAFLKNGQGPSTGEKKDVKNRIKAIKVYLARRSP